MSATQQRGEARCDECGSAFFTDASAMAALCAECAHRLYGYDRCAHDIVNGRCRRCGWDGSVSAFTAGLPSGTTGDQKG